jgi:plastocyanin
MTPRRIVVAALLLVGVLGPGGAALVAHHGQGHVTRQAGGATGVAAVPETTSAPVPEPSTTSTTAGAPAPVAPSTTTTATATTRPTLPRPVVPPPAPVAPSSTTSTSSTSTSSTSTSGTSTSSTTTTTRPAATATVEERGMTFDPGQVTVAVGDTVVWDYLSAPDGGQHQVVVDGLNLGPQRRPGDRVVHVFTAPGTYAVRCAIHAGMTGTVVVQ